MVVIQPQSRSYEPNDVNYSLLKHLLLTHLMNNGIGLVEEMIIYRSALTNLVSKKSKLARARS